MDDPILLRALRPDDPERLLSDARRHPRRAHDLRGYVVDPAALEVLVSRGDPVIYETFEAPVPDEAGELAYGVTVIHPGLIGVEHFMTKGHFHVRRRTAEVYAALRGRGFLIMQSEQGEARAVPMEAGSVAYVPPGWGHRTVNADLAEPFVLFFAFPADAGHDYDRVARTGFSLIVVHRNGKPEVVKRKAWHGGGG